MSSFNEKLKRLDPHLSVTWDNAEKKYSVYRGREYILKVDRLDDRLIQRLYEIDTLRHPDYLKQIDKHNDKLDEKENRKIELNSQHLADVLTQRSY
jgi:hypothetical protein